MAGDKPIVYWCYFCTEDSYLLYWVLIVEQLSNCITFSLGTYSERKKYLLTQSVILSPIFDAVTSFTTRSVVNGEFTLCGPVDFKAHLNAEDLYRICSDQLETISFKLKIPLSEFFVQGNLIKDTVQLYCFPI